MTKLTHISVPLWQGAEKPGMNLAPETLRQLGLESMLASKYTVNHYRMQPLNADEHANKYTVLADYIGTLKREVLRAFEQASFPLLIGGNHALGLGSAAATIEHFDNAGIIWFDAHCDMNTEATSPTGHIHGMPLAALMGLCSSDLNAIPTRYIKPENIIWIGPRSIDKGERKLINDKHLYGYTAEEIHQQGMANAMNDVIQYLNKQGIKHIHLSIDVDALDPKFFPATSVPEADGLTLEDFNLFVQGLSHLRGQVEAMDWVEYNPTLDNADQACGKWCVSAIEQLLQTIL